MTSLISRQRKTYLAVGSVLCLIYTVHVTVRTFVQIDRTCEVSRYVQKVKPNRQFVYAILKRANKSKQLGSDLILSENDSISTLSPNYVRTDYFGCLDFQKLPYTTQAIAENTKGNRGISFMKVRIDGVTIDAVYKEASMILHTFSDEYKYNTAKREIEYLTKLRGLPGIPRLFGSCIMQSNVTYLVERIHGYTLCNDNGTTVNCSSGTFLIDSVGISSDPPLAALRVAYTTTRLFKLLEERHLFFEDISGVNLMVGPRFEVFLVDADSLVFYNESRLSSKLLCSIDDHCPGPTGNLWVDGSLNNRIYSRCRDRHGICEHGRCRGFDVSLHACGMSEWYICKLTKFFKDLPEIEAEFESVCTCLRQPYPQNRCSFTAATERLEKLLSLYQKN